MQNKNDYKKVAAWFLGPKGENGDMFHTLISDSINEHIRHRQEHYKAEDPVYITEDIRQSEEYQKQRVLLQETQKELTEKLHGCVPFYTPRYQAHMLWDTVIPGMMGYMTAMLYNQNNVATEASPATSQMELEAGQQLCKLLELGENAWGHITADGSIANLESMWAARNIKYYPLAVAQALENVSELAEAKASLQVVLPTEEQKNYMDCDVWELLNLSEDTILDLPKKIMELCKVSSDQLNEYLSAYLLQNKGLAYYAKKYPDMKEPKIFVPATNHYSWPKSATILGLGKDCVEGIPVNSECRMNNVILTQRLEECAKEHVPVIMVVAVIGSTEEGAVDEVSGIIWGREHINTRKDDPQLLYYHIHCDAAWGGYLKTMLMVPEQEQGLLKDERGFVPFLPMSEYARRQYESIKNVDTVTIDPHKAGFIPYPAGSLCYKNEKLRSMITFDAAYIHSDPGLNMGIYGVEGSKPGASAAAVWTAHKVIPLDQSGYGLILGECAFSTKRYYCQWATLAEAEDDFEIRMLVKLPHSIKGPCYYKLLAEGEENVKQWIRNNINSKTNEEIYNDQDAMYVLSELGTDVLINSFVVNYKVNGEWNQDPQKMNELNQKLFQKFSISDPTTAEADTVEYMLMMTDLNTETYQASLEDMTQAWGMDLKGVKMISCLVNTIMNPWTTTDGFMEKIMAIFKKGVQECVAEIKGAMDE